MDEIVAPSWDVVFLAPETTHVKRAPTSIHTAQHGA